MTHEPSWLTKALADGSATIGPQVNLAAFESVTTGVVTIPDPRKPIKLVDPLCLWLKDALTLVVPLVTVGEANGRDWKGRNRRSGAAWKAVRQVARIGEFSRFEARIRAGKAVSAHFVRLGGRELDRMVNLPSALKGVEDAVAYLVGVDDRSPLWVPSCGQEPGPRYGVRVELRIPPDEDIPRR